MVKNILYKTFVFLFLIQSISVSAKAAEISNRDLEKMINEMLASHEKEIKKLQKMKKNILPKGMGNFDEITDELDESSARIRENFSQIQKDMDEIINRLRTGAAGEDRRLSNVPKLEIQDGQSAVDIRAEIPGMARDEIKVELKGNNLIIQGNRKGQEIKQSGSTSTSEFVYGEFKRSLILDKHIDSKTLKTEYRDGILRIHLDKKHQI